MAREVLDRWWAVVLRGAVAVLFGAATLIWPGLTLGVLIVLYGIYAVVDGAFGLLGLLSGARPEHPWWVRLLDALVSLGAGLVALFWPGITSLALLWLVAGWALAKGVLQIILAVSLRRRMSNVRLLALAGVISVILGIVYVLFPQAGILSLVWVLGLYALVYGIVLFARGLALRVARRALGRPSARR